MDTQEKNYIDLSQLCAEIDKVVIDNFEGKQYNVLAEIMEYSDKYVSIIFITLYQKNTFGKEYSIKGVVYSQDFQRISQKLKTANYTIGIGLKTVFTGVINFHNKNGIGFRVLDVDVNFLIGENELKKRNIREKLTSENLFNSNKQKPLPKLLKNIAIISSITSDGLIDFKRIIKENEQYIKLNITYFYSSVQGLSAKTDMLKNFRLVYNDYKQYDLLLIMRGGGSNIDLEVFNDYDLAKSICVFPIPVFTGIGHTRDKNILDEVANMYFDTPSKLAVYLSEAGKKLHDRLIELKTKVFDNANKIVDEKGIKMIGHKKNILNSKQIVKNKISDLNEHVKVLFKTHKQLTEKRKEVDLTFRDLKNNANNYLNDTKTELLSIPDSIKTHFGYLIRIDKKNLKTVMGEIKSNSSNYLSTSKKNITDTYKTIGLLSPKMTLKRGYSLTFFNKKVLRDIKKVKENEVITTMLDNGTIESRISNINKEK